MFLSCLSFLNPVDIGIYLLTLWKLGLSHWFSMNSMTLKSYFSSFLFSFFFPCFFNGFDLTKMAKLVSCFTQSCVLGFISITFKLYICCVLAAFCCRNYEDKGTKNHSLDFCLWEDGKFWSSIWYLSEYNSGSSLYMLFCMPLKCHLGLFLL